MAPQTAIDGPPMIDLECLRKRCVTLRHNCNLLRQIHSNRMNTFQSADVFVTTGTIVIAALLTFMGFSGLDKITKFINGYVYSVSADLVEFSFNMIVFLVLLFTILNISFQFKEKSFRHWRAINLITDFVTDIDTIMAASSFSEAELEKHMLLLTSQYKHITDVLPPSSDRDYFRAKRMMAKRTKSEENSGVAENEQAATAHHTRSTQVVVFSGL
jgi:uncharacterized protein